MEKVSFEIYFEDLNETAQKHLEQVYNWFGFEQDDRPQVPIAILEFKKGED